MLSLTSENPPTYTKPSLLLILLVACVLTVLNAIKPVHMDDNVYIAYAAEFIAHPLNPYDFNFGSPTTYQQTNCLFHRCFHSIWARELRCWAITQSSSSSGFFFLPYCFQDRFIIYLNALHRGMKLNFYGSLFCRPQYFLGLIVCWKFQFLLLG